jgi:flagellar assembly factor FliW
MPRQRKLKDGSLWIPHGMIGFPGLTRYRLLPGEAETPFFVLQCEEKKDLRFPLIDATVVRPDYALSLPEAALDELEIEGDADAVILALITVPRNPRETTVNLRAPLVAGRKTHVAKQIILEDESYPLRALLAREFRTEPGEVRLS